MRQVRRSSLLILDVAWSCQMCWEALRHALDSALFGQRGHRSCCNKQFYSGDSSVRQRVTAAAQTPHLENIVALRIRLEQWSPGSKGAQHICILGLLERLPVRQEHAEARQHLQWDFFPLSTRSW